MVQPLWEMVWQFLIKLNTVLPYNLAIKLLTVSPELKTYVYTKTCTQVFMATFSLTAKI